MVFQSILLGLVLNELVDAAHRLHQAVIQIGAEHKRQNQRRQAFGCEQVGTILQGQYPSFEPCKTLPWPGILLEIHRQGRERQCAHAGTAIRPQPQVNPKHKPMLTHVSDELGHQAHPFQEVLLVGDDLGPWMLLGSTRVAILLVHINDIDVARDIELFGTEFAHGHHPNVRLLARCRLRQSPLRGQRLARTLCGLGQCKLRQSTNAQHHLLEPQTLVTIQGEHSLHDQLPEDSQCTGQRVSFFKRLQRTPQVCLLGQARREKLKLKAIALANSTRVTTPVRKRHGL